MKKIILFLILFLGLHLSSFSANVMPYETDKTSTYTLGVYQAPKSITLYKQPDEKSDIIHSIQWSNENIFPENVSFENLFLVFIPKKELGLLTVTDETEDWVEVIYNKSTGDKAWLKKDDPYRFATWINFYNMYGRKYGLYILKGAPKSVNEIRSATDDKAQLVETMNMPSRINLNVIRGNWALVSVMDMDKTAKTGYIRWRSDNGIKYLFPDIK